VDASGIAHLVEHLVFRYSTHFPHGHDLFVANTLLPVKINASTHDAVTYFYITATNQQVFLAGLFYLQTGLQQRDYPDAAFYAERDGVLQRELQWLESDPTYLAQAQQNRAASPCVHAGGYSDLMPFNNRSDVGFYKKICYAQEQLCWLINSKSIAADALSDIVLTADSTSIPEPNSARCTDQNLDQQLDQHFAKFPAVIQQLLTYFETHYPRPALSAGALAQLTDYLLSRAITPQQASIPAPHVSVSKVMPTKLLLSETPRSLADVCKTHLSAVHIPELPRFIQAQLHAADDQLDALPASIQLTPISPISTQSTTDKIASLDIISVCQPQYWALRLTGQCYAMGIGHYQGQYWRYVFAPEST
jgi:hypothetical protein